MNVKGTFIIWPLMVALLCCSRQPEPRHVVILIDVSGSIDHTALQQGFKRIDELVGHLKRGDRIAIVPILGDAQAEASGRIIRFEVPNERRAYDTDLRDFRRKLSASLAEMQANAVAHPGSKTDILGSVALAEQEFQTALGVSRRLLIVLSDFIQEDREIDFRSDKRLDTVKAADQFAKSAVKKNSLSFKGIQIYLGLIRSYEFIRLMPRRRDSIQEFWAESFRLYGGQPTFVTDGPGLLERSIPLHLGTHSQQ